MTFWSLGDGTGSRVEKKLKTIDLSSRKIEEKNVAIINFGINERYVAIVEAVVRSIVLRIRRRSQILRSRLLSQLASNVIYVP